MKTQFVSLLGGVLLLGGSSIVYSKCWVGDAPCQASHATGGQLPDCLDDIINWQDGSCWSVDENPDQECYEKLDETLTHKNITIRYSERFRPDGSTFCHMDGKQEDFVTLNCPYYRTCDPGASQ